MPTTVIRAPPPPGFSNLATTPDYDNSGRIFFRSFFGRIEDTIFFFDIYWPLVKIFFSFYLCTWQNIKSTVIYYLMQAVSTIFDCEFTTRFLERKKSGSAVLKNPIFRYFSYQMTNLLDFDNLCILFQNTLYNLSKHSL